MVLLGSSQESSLRTTLLDLTPDETTDATVGQAVVVGRVELPWLGHLHARRGEDPHHLGELAGVVDHPIADGSGRPLELILDPGVVVVGGAALGIVMVRT